MREQIDPFDYGTQILKGLNGGCLLTTSANGKINTMTIGWGFLGIDWQTPIFLTLIRTNRLTRSCLDSNPEFTLNVPLGDVSISQRKILAFAGTKSGRDIDKIQHLGLELVQPMKVSVPAIRQFPLTLECSVIYRQPQDPTVMSRAIIDQFHPQHIDPSAPGVNRDFHTAYYGAIVAAYILR